MYQCKDVWKATTAQSSVTVAPYVAVWGNVLFTAKDMPDLNPKYGLDKNMIRNNFRLVSTPTTRQEEPEL